MARYTEEAMVFPKKLHHSALTFVAMATLAIVGCANPDSSDSAPTVSDSAGVRIVDYSAPPSPESTWTIEETPAVELGLGPVEPDLFFNVTTARVQPNGNILVVDGGAGELKYFGPDGDWIRTVGTEGEGPGEFRQITGAGAFSADSLAVYDIRLRRLSVFDSAGSYFRQFNLAVGEGTPAGVFHGILRDGSTVSQGFSSGDGTGRSFQTIPLYHFSRGGDYLGEFPRGWVSDNYIEQMEGGIWFTTPPFIRGIAALVGGESLLLADAIEHRFDLWDANRTHQLSIRRNDPIPAVTRELLDLEVGRLLSDIENENSLARTRRAFAEMEMPETLPAFGRVEIADDGSIWVEDYRMYDTDPSNWTVYGSDGLVLARLAWPQSFDAYQIGEDFILGRWTDEFGVNRIRLYRLNRS